MHRKKGELAMLCFFPHYAVLFLARWASYKTGACILVDKYGSGFRIQGSGLGFRV